MTSEEMIHMLGKILGVEPEADDLISRQGAINALLDMTEFSSVQELHDFVVAHKRGDYWDGGILQAIDVITALGSRNRFTEHHTGHGRMRDDMTIDRTTFGHLAICAIRYCHGRQTYMPSTIQGIVREHLKEISDKDLYVMIRDCKDMSDFDFGSETIDKPNWLRFRQDLEAEWERRGHADIN